MNSNLVLGASWFKVKTAFHVVDNPSCAFVGLNPLRITNSCENDLTIIVIVSFCLVGWTQDPKASQAVAKAGTYIHINSLKSVPFMSLCIWNQVTAMLAATSNLKVACRRN